MILHVKNENNWNTFFPPILVLRFLVPVHEIKLFWMVGISIRTSPNLKLLVGNSYGRFYR